MGIQETHSPIVPVFLYCGSTDASSVCIAFSSSWFVGCCKDEVGSVIKMCSSLSLLQWIFSSCCAFFMRRMMVKFACFYEVVRLKASLHKIGMMLISWVGYVSLA